MSKFGVSDLAASEQKANLNLMSFLKKASSSLELNIEVVVANLQTDSNLLYLGRALVFARLSLLLAEFVLVLAPVDNLYYRRFSFWSNLCQIKSGTLSAFTRLRNSDDACLRAGFVYKTYVWCGDLMIQAGTLCYF